MGIELELAVLLALAILGPAVFAVFEIETPWWRKALKWTLLCGATLALHRIAGHWALVIPVAGAAAGLGVHLWWCRTQGIDPLRATPRRRYYELRGWEWPG
jgi:hypothetical protein